MKQDFLALSAVSGLSVTQAPKLMVA
jgi:hypothetical protein